MNDEERKLRMRQYYRKYYLENKNQEKVRVKRWKMENPSAQKGYLLKFKGQNPTYWRDYQRRITSKKLRGQ